MPIQIPLVAGTLVWLGFLNTETGWLNGILGVVGLQGPDWINTELSIFPALSLIGLWGVGNFMIINIAGLQSVPTELYEAAQASTARAAGSTFRRITIPLISPVLLYDLVISLIGASQYFTQAYVLSNGRGRAEQRDAVHQPRPVSARRSATTTWGTVRDRVDPVRHRPALTRWGHLRLRP